MIWLAEHMVLWLGISFALGLVMAVATTVRRVTTERWEEVPVEARAVSAEPGTGEQDAPEGDPVAEEETAAQSPFPTLEGADDPAPWQREEQWSRPARVAAGTRADGPADEWEDAASNWRTWASEAAGARADADDEPGSADLDGVQPGSAGRRQEAVQADDRELFARDRTAGEVQPPPVAEPVAEPVAGPVAGSTPADPFPTIEEPAEQPLPGGLRPAALSDEELFARDRELHPPAPWAGDESDTEVPEEVSAPDGVDPTFPPYDGQPATEDPALSAWVGQGSEEDADSRDEAQDAPGGVAAPVATAHEPDTADEEPPEVAPVLQPPTELAPSEASGDEHHGVGDALARPFRRRRRSEVMRERRSEVEPEPDDDRAADPPAASSWAKHEDDGSGSPFEPYDEHAEAVPPPEDIDAQPGPTASNPPDTLSPAVDLISPAESAVPNERREPEAHRPNDRWPAATDEPVTEHLDLQGAPAKSPLRDTEGELDNDQTESDTTIESLPEPEHDVVTDPQTEPEDEPAIAVVSPSEDQLVEGDQTTTNDSRDTGRESNQARPLPSQYADEPAAPSELVAPAVETDRDLATEVAAYAPAAASVEAHTHPEPDPDVDDRGDGTAVGSGIPRPYGPGSAYAPADGSIPVGYAIKGQLTTMLFYPRTARFYTRVVADVYFDTEEAAEQAGFIRFDRRSSSAHVSLRPETLR